MNKKILYVLILLTVLFMFPLAWSWSMNNHEGLEVEKQGSVDETNIFKQLQMLANGSPVADILDQSKIDAQPRSALEQVQVDLKKTMEDMQNMLNSDNNPMIKK